MRPRFPIEAAGVFLLLFLLTLLLCWPAREAGFTSDFTAHMEMFVDRTGEGWWNSFGWRGNQPFLFGFMYLWHQWFGMAGLPWFLLFAFLHALNGSLLYHLYRRLGGVQGASVCWPALAAALLFTIHPYQVEVLTWKVCVHYLLSTGSLLGMIWLLTAEGGWSRWRWVAVHLLFAMALFSLELALIYPLILAGTLWWWSREKGWTSARLYRRLAALLAPQSVLVGAYFLWNRLRLGHWVGHYGEDVHLRVAPEELVSHLLNYYLKYTLFTRDWPVAWKGYLGDWHFRDPGLMYFCAALGLGLLAGLLVYSRRTGPAFRAGLWALLAFFLALAPVISLYYAWLGHNENDRYGYLASAFFVLALVLLTRSWPRYLLIAGFLLYGGVGMGLFRANVDRWTQGQRVYAALLADYRWADTAEVWVLAMPDSYDGIMLFRGFTPGEGLRDALHWIGGRSAVGGIVEVAAFVVRQPGDGTEAFWLDERRVRVRFRQWGNWFVRQGLGASDYRGEGYEVVFDEGGYTLIFERPDPNRVLIYSDGGRWKQLEPHI
jgi:hypothetical protein